MSFSAAKLLKNSSISPLQGYHFLVFAEFLENQQETDLCCRTCDTWTRVIHRY